MKTLFSSSKALVVVFVLAFVVIILSSKLLVGARIDLTESGLYTLSEGTERILGKLEQPVELTLYFSDKATTQLPVLRTYASRVEELLLEYQALSKGKLSVTVVDPVPFSEAEDAAALAGLQGVPGGTRGDPVYFGLVARAVATDVESDGATEAAFADGAEEVIPFLQPDREIYLEYELTRLISSLSKPALPTVGVVAGMEIEGGYDMMMRQSTPPWAILQYIEEGFQIDWIEDDATEISGVDVLLLMGPQNMSAQLQFAVDQYVLQGGTAIVFVDPYVESLAAMGGMPSVQRADLSTLLQAWGLQLREDAVLGDFDNSLVVSIGQGQQPVRHLGILGMQPPAIESDDIVLSGLESLNLSSVGILDPLEGSTVELEPLLQSSTSAQPHSAELWTQLSNPQELLSDFAPTGERYLIAARVSGSANTAFPDGISYTLEEPADSDGALDSADGEAETAPAKTTEREVTLQPKVTQGEAINVIVVADTDLLSDRLWVQVQNFFGQQIVTPWADNGSFLSNSLEQLSGDPDLIEIRSQGRFNRPFEKVEALRLEAEERFLAQQEILEAELSATETKLVELESMRNEGDASLFTAEQEQELINFQTQKLKIRKQLRDVQHQLDQDIEALGTQLKLINILLVPGIICLLAAFAFARRRLA